MRTETKISIVLTKEEEEMLAVAHRFVSAQNEELRKRAEQQKRIERIFGKVVPVLCFLLLSGCASIVSTVGEGHPNRTTIAVPPGSIVIMKSGGIFEDYDKDGLLEIPRGGGPFQSNSGMIEKEGVTIGIVRRGVTPWVLGNFLPYNGVVIGMIVDFAGGGAFDPRFVPTSTEITK